MNYFTKTFPLLFCLFFGIISLSAQWRSGIRGEGQRVTKSINLEKMDAINLGIAADVYLMEGNKQKIEIKGQENIIENIKREVRNGTWEIKFDKNVRNMEDVVIYITLPTFSKLSIGGSGNIKGKNAFNHLGNLKISIAGSGEVELEGVAEDLDVSIAGSGDVNVSGLKVKDCEVSIAGSGDCEVNVSAMLKVSIAGSGDVKYRGNPEKLKSSISGSGNISSF